MGQSGSKTGFFNVLENLAIDFFQNLVYKKILYLLYSSTNPILGKYLVADIWAKMLSTNQIAVFLN